MHQRKRIASGNCKWLYEGGLHVGAPKKMFMHRLVALAFIPNPKDLPCINHKDENKLNNSVDNLEWCTHKYNQNYGTISKRKSETEKNTKARMKALGLKYGR